jgi:di/tricarboxylate transporter
VRSIARLATYVVFSVVVAAILAAILPALALLYVAIAVVGGFMLLAGPSPGPVSRRSEQGFRALRDDYVNAARDRARKRTDRG